MVSNSAALQESAPLSVLSLSLCQVFLARTAQLSPWGEAGQESELRFGVIHSLIHSCWWHMLDIQCGAGDTTPNKNEEWWRPASQSVLTVPLILVGIFILIKLLNFPDPLVPDLCSSVEPIGWLQIKVGHRTSSLLKHGGSSWPTFSYLRPKWHYYHFAMGYPSPLFLVDSWALCYLDSPLHLVNLYSKVVRESQFFLYFMQRMIDARNFPKTEGRRW